MDLGVRVKVGNIELDRFVDRLGVIRDSRGVTIQPVLSDNVAFVAQEIGGLRYMQSLSAAVAEAYLPAPANAIALRLVDGDPLNCCIDNLQWLTPEIVVEQYQMMYKLTPDVVYGDNWKTVDTPAGQLEVSPLGVIRDPVTRKPREQRILEGDRVIYYVDKTGDKPHTRPLYVNKLVATAWIPNPHDYYFVCHMNEDPTDCSVYNLCWNGVPFKHHSRSGPRIDIAAIHDACKLMARGDLSDVEISKMTGIHKAVLSDIRNGKRHRDIAKQYTFPTKKLSAETRAKIVKLIDAGMKRQDILREVGLEYNASSLNHFDRIRAKHLRGKFS